MESSTSVIYSVAILATIKERGSSWVGNSSILLKFEYLFILFITAKVKED